MSGWITTFCLFTNEGKWLGDQRKVRADTWGTDHHFDTDEIFAPEGWIILNSNDIPSGSVKCDVEVNDHGTSYKCELVAGHSAFQVPSKHTVQPFVSWSISIKEK